MERNPMLLENSRRCIERAAELLRAAHEGYTRGHADEEPREWCDELADQVDALAQMNP